MLDFWTIEKNYKAAAATTVKAETSTASYVTSPSLFSKETGSSGSTVSNVNSVFGPFLPTEKTQVLTEIPGWSVLKDDNERQKSLNTYLEKFSTKEAQEKEIERLISISTSRQDITFLSGTLKALRDDVVVGAAKCIVNIGGSKDLKTHAGVSVANEIPKVSENKRLDVLLATVCIANPEVVCAAASKVSSLPSQDQVTGAKAVTLSDSEALKKYNDFQAMKNNLSPNQLSELRRRGAKGLAPTIQNCSSENQLTVTKIVVGSNNEEAIAIGASHTSELAKENQTTAVGEYKKATISDEAQKNVDKIIINQYSEFARENQVDIHTIMSDSKFTETVEYAAQNIYKFAKENQIKAVNITIGTDNEKAILAAASQAYKCSQENQEAIKTALVNTSFESVRKEVARQDQIKTDEPTKTKKEEAINDVKDKETQTQKIALEQKIAKIEEKIQNKEDITEDVGELSNAQKIILLKQCPSAEVVKAMIDLGASTEILAHIKVSTITQINYKKMTGTIINFLSDDVQQYIVTKCASDGNLDSISRKYLKAGAKKIYDKAIEEKENKEKRGVTLG